MVYRLISKNSGTTASGTLQKYSKEEITKELEMLRRKIIYHSNKVSRTVSMKDHNLVIQSPKIKGTSSFLTYGRQNIQSTGPHSPDSNKYTPHYTALYANLKCVIPWEKSISRRDLFTLTKQFSITRKNSTIGKTNSALPTTLTSTNNTILLPRLFIKRTSSIQILNSDSMEF